MDECIVIFNPYLRMFTNVYDDKGETLEHDNCINRHCWFFWQHEYEYPDERLL